MKIPGKFESCLTFPPPLTWLLAVKVGVKDTLCSPEETPQCQHHTDDDVGEGI